MKFLAQHSAFRVVLRVALLVAASLLAACSTWSGGSYGPGAGHFDTVIVDAGHGGHDTGAHSRAGYNEKMLTLDTARRLADILRSRGLRVIETRTGDYFVTLGNRVAISNARRNAVFVSVHYNWTRRSAALGVETYYYSLRSRRLAANIQKQTIRAYPTSNRGIKQRGFYVLRNNSRPAVLCELGFVSNPAENAKLQRPEVRQRLAERIAAGIIAEKNGQLP